VRIGVDVGGTTTEAVALDPAGAVTASVRSPTRQGSDGVIQGILDAVARLEVPATSSPGRTIGIGIPGIVDSRTGLVRTAVHLDIAELRLADELSARLGSPVRVENDVNAAALGAAHLAPATDGTVQSIAYLSIGTGLAAGLVLRGRLWRGDRGGAGEIGHFPVDPAGVLCRCGQRGCLETLASGSALRRRWTATDVDVAQSLLAAVRNGDPAADEVWRSFTSAVAVAVRLLLQTFDVERVLLGGGVSALGQPLLDAVRAALARDADSSPFLAALDAGQRVSAVLPAVPVGAYGAALAGAVPFEEES